MKDSSKKTSLSKKSRKWLISGLAIVGSTINAATRASTGDVLGGLTVNLLTSILHEKLSDLDESKKTIDEKIQKALEALREASKLVGELEENLTERMKKLDELRQEVDRYSQIAEVEQQKAKAIIEQVELSVNKGKPREYKINFLINIGAGLLVGLILFALGLILSPILTPHITKWLGLTS